MADNNKWEQPDAPPPPLFTGEKERNLVKQVNDELIERVIGQQVLYYSVDIDRTNFHDIYGEAIIKTCLPPIRVHALVTWGGFESVHTKGIGMDKQTKITINFHKRRLTEDQNLFVREGDFVRYGSIFYEIVKLNEPKHLFGQADTQFEITADCIRARDGVFNAE